MNYLGHPHAVSKYISTIPLQFDFEKKHAIVVEGTLDSKITYTTVADIAEVVTQAVEYDGEWPTIGGIRGSRVTIGEMLKIGERVLGKTSHVHVSSSPGLMRYTGKPLTIEYLQMEDLAAGELKTKNYHLIDLPSIPKDQVGAFSKMATIGVLISCARGVWTVSDEWNQRLPGVKFTQVEEFLGKLFK